MSLSAGLSFRRWIRWLGLGLILGSVGMSFLSSPLLAAPPQGNETQPAGASPPGSSPSPLSEIKGVMGEAVVKFREGTTADQITAINKQIGAEVVKELSDTFQWVRARGYSDDDLLQAYVKHSEVESATRAPNRMR